jgi:lipopolysaccharide export system protein LptC
LIARSFPWLPVSILFVLVIVTFWLSRFVQPLNARDASGRTTPDLVVEKFSAQKLSEKGDVQYTVNSDKMSHFAIDDSSLLENVIFIVTEVGQPKLTARSPRGKLINGGDEVQMDGGVVLNSEAGAKSPPLKLTTPKLTILPKQNIAKSNDGVVLESPSGKITAASFVLNTVTKVVNLERLNATYQSTIK